MWLAVVFSAMSSRCEKKSGDADGLLQWRLAVTFRWSLTGYHCVYLLFATVASLNVTTIMVTRVKGITK